MGKLFSWESNSLVKSYFLSVPGAPKHLMFHMFIGISRRGAGIQPKGLLFMKALGFSDKLLFHGKPTFHGNPTSWWHSRPPAPNAYKTWGSWGFGAPGTLKCDILSKQLILKWKQLSMEIPLLEQSCFLCKIISKCFGSSKHQMLHRFQKHLAPGGGNATK